MNRFIFFNGFHIGDLLINKPFIKEIMKQIPGHNFFVSHYNNELITSDLCPFIPPDSIQIPREDTFITKYESTTIMNTWFGVLDDGLEIKIQSVSNGTFDRCLFEQQFDTYNQLLKPIGLDISYMENHPEDYIWEIENKYINNTLPTQDGFKVLIYTNVSLSGQSDNQNQSEYINNIADKYPYITFYISDGTINKTNVICLNKHFIQKGLDLFQTAELSKKCNIIAGGGSGPLMFTWLKSNLLNKDKIYIVQHKYNWGESQFTSKQLNRTINVTSTADLFKNLDIELERHCK